MFVSSLGVSEIGDSHQMIIEIIDGDWYTVKVTIASGDTTEKKFDKDNYSEVKAYIDRLLAGYHPDQKKIEDYGSE